MRASVEKRFGKLKSTVAPMLWRRGGINSALRRARGACRTRLSESGLQSARRGGARGGRNKFRAPTGQLASKFRGRARAI